MFTQASVAELQKTENINHMSDKNHPTLSQIISLFLYTAQN